MRTPFTTWPLVGVVVGCTGPAGDAPPADTGDTSAPVQACAELAPVGTVLEPDGDGPDTQIHASSAFDGTGVWVAWNRPDDAGLFDVWVARLACDGTVDVGPLEVTDSADNEIDPAVAVGHDRVLVTWQSDNGGYPDNLDIRWQVLEHDGTAVGGVHELDEPGNQWMPAAATTPTGFVLAGSGSGGQVFEAFTQALTPDGDRDGPRTDVDTDPGGGEVWPSVAVDDAGTVHLAWEGDDLGYTAVGASAITWPGPAAQPSVSAWGDQVWLGYSDTLGDLFIGRPDGAPMALRDGDRSEHTIAVAAGPDGGHAVWSTNVSGLDNKLKLGRFDGDGALLDTLDLGTETAPPYPVNLTRIDDDVVFFAWQDGENPDYRIKAGFFEL